VARIKLPFVNSFVDRHGQTHHYFRRRGHRNVRLPGLPGSPEFMRAYEAAIGNAEPTVIGVSRSKVGTVAAVVRHVSRLGGVRRSRLRNAPHPP
jgi:hypothetical protein